MTFNSIQKNELIVQLTPTVAKRVYEAAEFVHLDLRESLYVPGAPCEFVDFPVTGVMSILTPMENGVQIEVATVGKEGMIGIQLAMGIPVVEEIAFCQVEGTAWRLPAEVFTKLLGEYPELLRVCQRYSMVLFNQVAVNTGCNHIHTVEARCARWLLMTQDRCASDEFLLTQEFLAGMLAVSRAAVNSAAGVLSKASLISYARGKIKILDRAGLQKASCQCYFKMRKYADFVYGMSKPVE